MKTKESCIAPVRRFQAKHAIEAPEENVIAALHLMNSMAIDVHAAMDQSSRGAGDNGIDAWHLDDTCGTLYVFQSKFSESKPQVIRGLDDLQRAKDWIESAVIDGQLDRVPDNTCLYNLHSALSQKRDRIQAVLFVLLSLFDENEIEDEPECNTLRKALAQSRLHDYLRHRGGRIELHLEQFNLSPSLVRTPKVYRISKISDARMWLRKTAHLDLAYVSLHSLVELFRQRGNALFDKNVRLALTSVKEVRDRLVHPMTGTLASICNGDLHPSIFTFYHIGVTIAASSVPSSEDEILALEAPSIINGCQTINIANEYLRSLEKQSKNLEIERFKEIRVIAKVVVGTSTDELKEITNANNRQNPIETWQLYSNEPIHITVVPQPCDWGTLHA